MKQTNSTKSKLTAATAIALFPISTAFLALGQPAMEDSLPEPKVIIVDKSLSNNQAEQSIHAAKLFYAFWNTGDSKFATLALATNFTDRTLPKGRPKGVSGPIFASNNFRKAVPDLRCEIEQMIVAGDRVVSHLHFSGHFTGTFGEKRGASQTIDFIATDILRIQDSHVTDNWHIEDNLTLMQQMGVVQP